MIERAAPTCWAVIAGRPGVWTKRLLLATDPVPDAAVETFKFETQADKDITTRENAHRIAQEQRGMNGTLFEETPSGDLVAPGEMVTKPEAVATRNERTDVTLSHADPEWKARAWRWILRQRPMSQVTSDGLTLAVGMPPGHPSAVGALFNAAARAGLIEKSGAYVTSVRKTCNGAIIAVWMRTEVPGEPIR